jgi:hypothetical protein
MDWDVLRHKIWRVLNDPDAPGYTWVLWGINVCILISFGMLVIEVLGEPSPKTIAWFHTIDRGILLIFLVEYIARLAVIRNWEPKSIELTPYRRVKYFIFSRLRFMLSPWGLIDLVALLPIFPFLRSLRILRLLRLFRSAEVLRPVQGVFNAFRNNSLLFSVAFGFVGTSIVLSATMLFFAEYGENPQIDGFADTLWWAIVTISTVGFGDITPQTAGGRVIGASLMIAGMVFIAMLAGVISTTLVGQLLPLRKEQVRMSSTTDHTIILGWNDDVPMLLDQLAEERGKAPSPIIIMAPQPRPESLDTSITYVQGDFTKESELDKVRLMFAKTVIVVSDDSTERRSSQNRDASTVLALFTIRSRERTFEEERRNELHLVAEILDPENIQHAFSSGADEVIPSSLLGYGVIAHSADNPGIGAVVSDLMLATRDNLYTSDIPMKYIEGEEILFSKLQRQIQDEYDALVIGFRRNGDYNLNPARPVKLRISDDLVYLADHSLDEEL